MARADITPVTLTETGFNLTDATFTTMSTGAGNGVQFTQDLSDIIVMKNDTGGSATFTLKVPQPSQYSTKSVTVPDATLVVADGKTYVYKPSAIFKQSDGKMYIDCSVAGKVAVLSPNG